MVMRINLNNERLPGRNSAENAENLDNKNFGQKFWAILSNRQIQKQTAKAAVGAAASIVGIKSFYDVPEYFREKIAIKGSKGLNKISGGRFGKGVEGNIEDFLENFDEIKINRQEKNEKNSNTYKQIAMAENQGNLDAKSELEKQLIKKDKSKKLVDLEKRLLLSKDAKAKGSQARKIIAEIIRRERGKKSIKLNKQGLERIEYDKDGNPREEEERAGMAKKMKSVELLEKISDEYNMNLDWNENQKNTLMKGLLDDYIEAKVTGLQAGKEVLNTALVGFDLLGVRGIMYGTASIIERHRRKRKEARREKKDFEFGKAVIVDGLKEFGQGLTLKTEGNELQKGAAFAKSFGSLLRFAGIGSSALSGFSNEGEVIDEIINKIENKQLGDIAWQFPKNIADRIPGINFDSEAPTIDQGTASLTEGLPHEQQARFEKVWTWIEDKRYDRVFEKGEIENYIKEGQDITRPDKFYELLENKARLRILQLEGNDDSDNVSVEETNPNQTLTEKNAESASKTAPAETTSAEINQAENPVVTPAPVAVEAESPTPAQEPLTAEVKKGDSLTKIVRRMFSEESVSGEAKEAFINKYFPDQEINDGNRDTLLEKAINKMSISNLDNVTDNDVQNLIYEGNEVIINPETGEITVEKGEGAFEAKAVSEQDLREAWADQRAEELGLDPEKLSFGSEDLGERVIKTEIELGETANNGAANMVEVSIDNDGNWSAEVNGNQVGGQLGEGQNLEQEVQEAINTNPVEEIQLSENAEHSNLSNLSEQVQKAIDQIKSETELTTEQIEILISDRNMELLAHPEKVDRFLHIIEIYNLSDQEGYDAAREFVLAFNGETSIPRQSSLEKLFFADLGNIPMQEAKTSLNSLLGNNEVDLGQIFQKTSIGRNDGGVIINLSREKFLSADNFRINITNDGKLSVDGPSSFLHITSSKYSLAEAEINNHSLDNVFAKIKDYIDSNGLNTNEAQAEEVVVPEAPSEVQTDVTKIDPGNGTGEETNMEQVEQNPTQTIENNISPNQESSEVPENLTEQTTVETIEINQAFDDAMLTTIGNTTGINDEVVNNVLNEIKKTKNGEAMFIEYFRNVLPQKPGVFAVYENSIEQMLSGEDNPDAENVFKEILEELRKKLQS